MSAIEVKGLDQLLSRLKNAPYAIRKAVDFELKTGAQEIAREAKLLAPGDQSVLLRGIGSEPDGDLSYGVYSNAEYSAYVEFGTGAKVSIAVDPEIRAYEETFKGEKEVAGMYAQPFFFPALLNQTPIIIKRVGDALNDAV